jgi:two-component system response regulator HydG
VVDPDLSAQAELSRVLSRAGYRILIARDGREALASVMSGEADLIITESRLSELHGLELLSVVKGTNPSTPVLFLTRFGTIEDAVTAIKCGAYDFITKPFRSDRLLALVREALDGRPVRSGEQADERPSQDAVAAAGPVGKGPAFCQMMDLVRQVAPGSVAVLIHGESGSGKELVARTIHEWSQRSGRFIAMKCEAQPAAALQADLLGYEPGSSKGGPIAAKKGAVELANAGTLFLDEVADLPPEIQAKLVGVVERGDLVYPSSTEPIHVDVRVIAATTRDPTQLLNEGRLRRDLYLRLGVVTICVPPLRQRREDIPMLAQRFLRIYAAKNGRPLEGFTAEAMRQLQNFAWPGNVRELETVIERGVVLAKGSLMDVTDLRQEIPSATPLPEGMLTVRIGTPIAEIEQRMLDETLRVTQGNKTLAAKLLGIDVRTVARKVKRQ